MPTAKPNTRVHDTLPPVNHPIAFDLYKGSCFQGRVQGYVHQYDEGPMQHWTGRLISDNGVVERVGGRCEVQAPQPNRGGAPRKDARNIAVFLAYQYFELLGDAKPSDRVFELWQKRRAEGWRRMSRQDEEAAVRVEKEVPAKPGGRQPGYKGISDPGKVSGLCGLAEELLGTDRDIRGFGYRSDETSLRMIVILPGARLENLSNGFDLHGPVWLWAFGDEVATHFCRDDTMTFRWVTDAPAG
jgi:hypothetical protein